MKDYDTSSWFVVMWCNEGLECVVPISDIEKTNTFNILAGKPIEKNPNQILNLLMLRARYNSQRHYEIYAISATEGITEDDITSMFDANPQYAADLIRDRGQKIYSDRIEQSKLVIS